VNILLLSSGGGGGNILRSLKALFRRDLAVAQQTDAKYAERLKRAVVTRFLDTNEFSLSDVPKDERVLIGPNTTRRLGSRHNPDVARDALEESRSEVEQLLSEHSAVVLIGTGGKGTGAGTMFPLAQMAREQKKLLIPIFVRPSFERHEVEKRRFDHARAIADQFDAAQIRLIEILNDRAYVDSDPQPQSLVWERMNLPIARGLRGLLYVLSDLSQVDPSDLSTLFAGAGRLRIGFAEINPPRDREPSDAQVDEAVRGCWENPYYAFDGRVGTSLVCIQGDWSNLVDARIKGQLATSALSSSGADSPYNPLYARAFRTPRPWGVTALFAEYTGEHRPLDIEWSLGRVDLPVIPRKPIAPAPAPAEGREGSEGAEEIQTTRTSKDPLREKPLAPTPRFATLWEFAVAVNHADPAALALASNGAPPDFAIEAADVRKLVGTFWFRSVFPRLSDVWRERLLETLLTNLQMPDHLVKVGRHRVRLSELDYGRLQDVCSKAVIRGPVGTDVQLLLSIGKLWGPEVWGRLHFNTSGQPADSSKFAALLNGFLG
jgi:cell division GTPase FtsZ